MSFKFPYNSTIDGQEIYHEGNHGKNGDAHRQYLNIYGMYKTSRMLSSDVDKYAKIATITPTSIAALKIVGFCGEASGTTQVNFYEIFLRCNNTGGYDFYVGSVQKWYEDVVLIQKKDTSNKYIFELYIKLHNTYNQFVFSPMFVLAESDIVLENGSPFITLPVTDATYTVVSISPTQTNFALNRTTGTSVPGAYSFDQGKMQLFRNNNLAYDQLIVALNYKNSISYRTVLTEDYCKIGQPDTFLPTASADYVGVMRYLRYSAQDAKLYICIQLADNTYAWKQVTLV